MLALPVYQPYAEAIMEGTKTAEYRSRPTAVRGRVWVYATKKLAPDADSEAVANLPRGKLVGTVEIVGCEQIEPGHWAWKLARPQRIEPKPPKKMPVSGNFFDPGV